ncbi:MAG TPA: metallophosphoesterase family protein [Planctomycetaceae bacterium]|nr:metallophosphoesterase family protein [Planctomycetaceae bacterium]
MKFLLFSDLHCDEDAARQLVARARHADVVIGAGDFGNVRRGVEICIRILQAIAKPAVLVPGNNETDEELRQACRAWPTAQVLHGSGTMIDGVPFFGIGGGIPITPFGDWSFDFSEEDATRMLAPCPAGAVLVAHSPPLGTLDQSSRGGNLGSTAIRDAILRVRPRLVVCGHIHASGGKQADLDGIPVINAGPLGMEWEV